MKSLKKWSIITLVLCVLFLALAVVCTVRPAGFGEWLVLTYEDLTCELGHTSDQIFSKLAVISYTCLGISFVVNQILLFVYVKKVKDLKENAENKTDSAPQTVIEKKTIFVLPHVKREKRKKREEENVVENQPTNQSVQPAQPVSKAEAMKNLLDSFRK